MRLSFTVQPDGTSGFDLQTDGMDHPGLVDLGFRQFNYMVKTFGEVNNGELPIGSTASGLLPPAGEGDSVPEPDPV